MDRQQLTICKARPCGDDEVADITITIDGTLHDIEDGDRGQFYTEQATELEAALHASLPGGTYDRLLIAMLERTASVLEIPYRWCLEKEAT